jgi:hypothetical protein
MRRITKYSLIEAMKLAFMACFKIQIRMSRVLKRLTKEEVTTLNTNQNL